MALEDEMKILDNLEEGVSKGGVGRPLGVSQATTRILKQNEKAIRASIFRHLLQVLCIPRVVNIEKMETCVDLLGVGLDQRGPVSDAEGQLRGQPREVFSVQGMV